MKNKNFETYNLYMEYVNIRNKRYFTLIIQKGKRQLFTQDLEDNKLLSLSLFA